MGHSTPIVVHVTYERIGGELDTDLMAICPHCLGRAGLVLAAGAQDLGGAYWNPEQYPYNAQAQPGDDDWRPGPDWPPSMREIGPF